MATAFTSRHDIARFGSEVIRGSPRQADLIIISGTVFRKMAPVVKRLYDQLLEPRWVISMAPAPTQAVCTISTVLCRSRQIFARRCLCTGLSSRPEALLQALMLLQESIGKERRPLSWAAGDQLLSSLLVNPVTVICSQKKGCARAVERSGRDLVLS